MALAMFDPPVSAVVHHIAVCAGDLGLDFGQIRHSVANGSPPLSCYFGAVLTGAKPWRWALPRYSGVMPRV